MPYSKLWKVPRRLVFVGCAFTEVPQIHLSSVKNPRSQLVPRQSSWRIFAMSIDFEEEPSLLSEGDNLSDNDEVNPNDSSEKFVSQHLDSHEVKFASLVLIPFSIFILEYYYMIFFSLQVKINIIFNK